MANSNGEELEMKKREVLHLLFAALLLVLAAFLFYDTLRLPPAAAGDKRLEVFGRIVGIVLTGIGGLYVLFVRKRDQDDLAEP
jgi:hypothetical protein